MTLIRLIALREITERGRTRSFRVALIISVVLAVAAVVIPKQLKGGNSPVQVGLVGAVSNQAVVLQAVTAETGKQIVIVPVASTVQADNALRAGTIAIAIANGTISVKQQPTAGDTSTTARVASALATTIGTLITENEAGLTPKQITTLGNAQPLPVLGLERNQSNRTREHTITLIGVLLMYAFLGLFGTWIMYGVVEEKQSRVVEILLATVRPTQLLTGKILGIGALAVLEAASVAIAVYIAALATGSDILKGAGGGLVIELVGWFLLGYALYSTLQAAAGSLVGRTEEVQNAVFPLQLPLIVGYIGAITTSVGNVSGFVKVLSFIPLTAPIAMPMRIASEPTPGFQVALSILLMLMAIVMAMRFGARVYAGAVLRTGRRLRWREALESAGT